MSLLVLVGAFMSFLQAFGEAIARQATGVKVAPAHPPRAPL
jgi:hypothetical protein